MPVAVGKEPLLAAQTMYHILVCNKGRVKASHRKGMQGSEQAPKGMTGPALEEVKKQFNKGTYLK